MDFRQRKNQEAKPGSINAIAEDTARIIANIELKINETETANNFINASGNNLTHDWKWYEKNDLQELIAMQKKNPAAFAELYKNEHGYYPEGIQFNIEASSNNQKHDWKWYEKNDLQELIAMQKKNPAAFAELYKNEHGYYPEGIQFNIEASSNNQNHDWKWYEKNDLQELIDMQKKNPAAFAELYKNEHGYYPEGIQFNNQ
jgi:hypothetical protein